jgi:hypothetical protein
MKRRKNKIFIIKGSAICIKEPQGRHGLDGFKLNQIYPFYFCDISRNEWTCINDGTFYKVFQSNELKSFERCGLKTFKKYFKEIK